jgi:uncharacterized membrane protein YbhN (UPF0104 family)
VSATPAQTSGGTGRKNVKRILSVVLSIAIVLAIFLLAIPKFADYGAVWDSIRTLTPLELWSLVAAMVFNLFTYWWANMAALPGLRLWPAAVLTQTTTSIANTLPGGGAIAVGMTYTILRSWGFRGSDTALYVGTTGIWNIFTKLALPVISVAFLVVSGHSSTTYVTAAVLGVGVLAVAVGCLAAVFSSERLARKVGDGLGRAASSVRRLFRRPAVVDGGERAAGFRRDTIGLVEHRWLRLTLTTLLSHLGLFAVLLLALRHMGVAEADVSTAEVFAVFAFSRLLSAVPVTPGGVGLIEGGQIVGLTHIDPNHKPEIVAAVLLFRLLTFGVQVPLGGFTYAIWRRKTSWRKEAPEGEPADATAQPSPAAG